MCQNTLWGIVTLSDISDIFVIINGRGMYGASVRVTVKLAFLVLPVLSCLSRVSFLDFEPYGHKIINNYVILHHVPRFMMRFIDIFGGCTDSVYQALLFPPPRKAREK